MPPPPPQLESARARLPVRRLTREPLTTMLARSLCCALLALLPALSTAGGAEPFLQAAQEIAPWIVEVRRQLHRIPETRFNEVKTSAAIRARLDELGIAYRHPFAITGVVATLGSGSPVVALRADFDALPMHEDVDLPFKSEHPGRMHACGHDSHAAMLLGAGKILKRLEADGKLRGTVKLMFQPGEEGGSGAKKMLDEGALAGVDVIFGIHTTADFSGPLPTGTITIADGPVMAGTGMFDAVITGKGGHGAIPHQTVDPVVAASAIIMALQTLVSRNTVPTEAAVVSVTKIHAGDANNVIPSAVEIGGTYRALSPDVFSWLQGAIKEKVQNVAAAYGCTATVDFDDGKELYTDLGELWITEVTPPLVNNATVAAFARGVADEIFGPGNVLQQPPCMAGEDFAFLTQAIPGAFAWVGHKNVEKDCAAANHNVLFQVDEDSIPYGAAMHAAFAVNWLNAHNAGASPQHSEL
mmetsp:Transcript_4718/g.16910  ORF Transcript_4718/g.16910 Transcript_4718/m.16910 type:complete len:470 (-) Transcript_4718:247-1656(-)